MTASGRTVRRKSLVASTVVAALATLGLELVEEASLPSLSRGGSHTLTIVCWTCGAAIAAAVAGTREAAIARGARTRPLAGSRRS
jgi:hypothetical protein